VATQGWQEGQGRRYGKEGCGKVGTGGVKVATKVWGWGMCGSHTKEGTRLHSTQGMAGMGNTATGTQSGAQGNGPGVYRAGWLGQVATGWLQAGLATENHKNQVCKPNQGNQGRARQGKARQGKARTKPKGSKARGQEPKGNQEPRLT